VPDDALDTDVVRKILCRCLARTSPPGTHVSALRSPATRQTYQRIGWTQGTEECMTYEIRPIGVVGSPLVDPASAPKQGVEGSPKAWLAFDPAMADGIRDLAVGDEVFVLTWLHLADRSVLAVHPRDDPRNPLTGVFSTRSSDRPNPIGLHRVRVLAIDGLRVRVADLEAVDGTPIVDVKPVLGTTR
jgi:tRNA-Thr(GGU) m(6)t(6)A37 methyltransferase TsaA